MRKGNKMHFHHHKLGSIYIFFKGFLHKFNNSCTTFHLISIGNAIWNVYFFNVFKLGERMCTAVLKYCIFITIDSCTFLCLGLFWLKQNPKPRYRERYRELICMHTSLCNLMLIEWTWLSCCLHRNKIVFRQIQ